MTSEIVMLFIQFVKIRKDIILKNNIDKNYSHVFLFSVFYFYLFTKLIT